MGNLSTVRWVKRNRSPPLGSAVPAIPAQRSHGRGPVPFYPSHSREVPFLFGAASRFVRPRSWSLVHRTTSSPRRRLCLGFYVCDLGFGCSVTLCLFIYLGTPAPSITF